jgi:hypothetical protein
MGVIMKINCLQKINYINIFNAYGLRLLVVILLFNKFFSSFVLIFNFSQSVESPQQRVGYSTSLF